MTGGLSGSLSNGMCSPNCIASAFALAFDSSTSSLFARGNFLSAGGVIGTSGLAKWDAVAAAWNALGNGGILSGRSGVYALALDASSGALYVGGSGMYGCMNCEYVFMWNIPSSTWISLPSNMGSGINHMWAVKALAVLTPKCPTGNVPATSGGACTPCRPGTYVKDYGSDRRECLPCPQNTANAATLSAAIAQCVACAPGTGNIAAGSTTCAQCPAGTYADVAGEGCKECPAGTSSAALGATSASTCVPCATGKSQPLSGKTSCDPCALGTSTSSPGGTTCATCPPNTFTPQPGEPCHACGGLGGGWYCTATAAAGQTWGVACAKCPKGTASVASDVTACDACGAGKYADDTGMTECKSCPAGTAVASNGSVALADCVSCGVGRTSATGSGTCSDCPVGTFGGAADNPTCAPCPANTFGDETKSQACKACPPGAASAIASVQPSACACGDPAMESGYTAAGTLECACRAGRRSRARDAWRVRWVPTPGRWARRRARCALLGRPLRMWVHSPRPNVCVHPTLF